MAIWFFEKYKLPKFSIWWYDNSCVILEGHQIKIEDCIGSMALSVKP